MKSYSVPLAAEFLQKVFQSSSTINFIKKVSQHVISLRLNILYSLVFVADHIRYSASAICPITLQVQIFSEYFLPHCWYEKWNTLKKKKDLLTLATLSEGIVVHGQHA